MIQGENKKGAKAALKKSESLFHKERIALVFKKVKRAIHSFFSSRIPLYLKSEYCRAIRSLCSFWKSNKSERAKSKRAKEQKSKRAKEQKSKEQKSKRVEEWKSERAKEQKSERVKEWKSERAKEQKSKRAKEQKSKRAKERRAKEQKREFPTWLLLVIFLYFSLLLVVILYFSLLLVIVSIFQRIQLRIWTKLIKKLKPEIFLQNFIKWVNS